jgi:Tfp pilus tip-associated adhesin PilY1
MNGRKILYMTMLGALLLVGAEGQAAVDIANYTSTPPFVTRAYAPNVLLLLSNDHTMAYRGHRGLTDYTNGKTYYGYFDPNKCYKYGDPNGVGHSYFYTEDSWNAFNHYTVDSSGREADGSTTQAQKDMWSGNFLNWVTMTNGDFVRKGLTGGQVIATDNSTYWILGRVDIFDANHMWVKTYVPEGTVNPDIGGLVPYPYSPADVGTFTPQYPDPANRVLYFDFEDTNWNGSTITDLGGAQNNGTASNGVARSTSALWGSKSADFDGAKGNVAIADHDEISNFGGKLTVEFWMNRDTNDNIELIIGNTSSQAGFQVVSMKGGPIRFELRNGKKTGILDSIDSPSNNAWHYIVCTYDSAVDDDNNPATPAVGVMRIYIDGCLNAESSTEFVGDIGNSTSNLILGQSKQYFDGRLDEVSLWKEAFTTTMVRSRYQASWGSRSLACFTVMGGGTFTFDNQHRTMQVKSADNSVNDTYTVAVRVTSEPHGLLQEFSSSVRFGMMSYAYGNSDEGGVVRANVSKPDEPGSEFGNIITFVNTFQEKGWDPGAELFWEATRYFRNSSYGGTAYSPDHVFCPQCGNTYNDGFNIVPWKDPMLNDCQKNYIIFVNDEYPTRDGNRMPGGYDGLPVESIADLAPAKVGAVTAPTGGLNTEWWTNKVGDLEGISGQSWPVGCYEANTDESCSTPKLVGRLGRAYGICASEPSSTMKGTFNLAGAAYWAHATHLRPDLVSNADVDADPKKQLSIETFTIAFRGTPNGYSVPAPPMNPLWLAAKYGGFQDKNGNNIPDLQSEWDLDGDGVPDNFSYAEDGEQLTSALRRAILSILARSGSGTAASILSASRTGEGALYQAMFYPSRVDRQGNQTEWSGYLDAFWVDRFGNLREDTPADPITPPTTITQPFTGTAVSTSGIELRQFNLYHDKVIKMFYDNVLGYTRAKLYEVSTLGRILSGKATKTATDVLWDSGGSFSQAGVQPGMKVENVTQGAIAAIDTPTSQPTVTATTVKATGMTWTVGDEYIISQAGPEPIDRDLEELNPIWDGARWLAEHGAKDRRIFTWVDLNNNGVVDGSGDLFGTLTSTDEVKELAGSGTQTVTIGTGPKKTTVTESRYVLESDALAAALKPYLRATSNLESAQIINWIRGVDPPGVAMRQRTFLTPDDDISGLLRTLKLGDIVNSTPTVIGTPTEDYDLMYKDSSYTGFYKAQGDRRNVVYLGANDGMLHAFNGGFYDRDYKFFYDHTGHDLGQELWAFVPYQLLPHLEFLTRPEYVHVYYVDQKPKVFDARIFTSDSTHVNGWGTLLIAGMRMGGNTMPVTGDFSNPPDGITETRTFRSAYFLLDVTDPLSPRFLGSFTDTNLGLTTSYPAIVRIQDKWFMFVGSGPNGAAPNYSDAYLGVSAQRGFLFVVEITPSGFTLTKKIPLPDAETTAFLGDPSSVDLDLTTGTSTLYSGGVNWTSDAIYIGSVYDRDGVSTSPYTWRGRMYHLRLTSDASMTTPDLTANSWAYAKLAESSASLDVGPITAAANVAKDALGRYWVYFGTGRYYASFDTSDTSTQKFFGLKEPVYTSGVDTGKPTFGSVTMEADTSPLTSVSLFDATNAKVYEGGSVDYNGDGAIDYVRNFKGFVNDLNAHKNGWLIRTSAGERILGIPNVIGGLTLFTSYVPPSGSECHFEGTSYLYAPYFKTGTAYGKSVIGLGADTYSGSQSVQRKDTLGKGLAATPTMHVGEKSKAFVQTSTGAIVDLETTTPTSVKSGSRSWRID